MKESIDTYFEQKKKEIEAFLLNEIQKLDDGSELFKAIKYGLFPGGKRLRPVLAFAISDVLGVSLDITPFASAVEVLHNASLYHDDLPIMDDDDFRRGRLSVHKKFSPAIALLAGDTLISIAYELVINSSYNCDLKIKLINLLSFSWGINGVCGGQSLEIEAESRRKIHPFEIFRRKTGALFGAVFKGVSILNRLTEREQEDFYSIGENTGIIFQINDDLDDKSDENYNSLAFFSEDELIEKKRDLVEKTLKMVHNYKLFKFPLKEILRLIWRI